MAPNSQMATLDAKVHLLNWFLRQMSRCSGKGATLARAAASPEFPSRGSTGCKTALTEAGWRRRRSIIFYEPWLPPSLDRPPKTAAAAAADSTRRLPKVPRGVGRHNRP